ncbi:hypothetical protein [Paracraurococcus ruber]|uniref:Uncharacterized protein n=1 Tax=Paracraurococcus ruber TaxID=77675 RepID=A0ABS1CS58_9PROT|nr:hypothetical protein [Paracraurococcus ruber]MBK1657300.1 hypothetical protein [Paracraurococcus ruber]TDG33444.1 hypothetical protein E2C05_03600 [Paracraurococcus ruber]
MRVWALGLLLLAGPAAGQGVKGPATADAVAGGLPADLAGWRRGAVTDFTQRPGGAGLGAAVEYRPAPGGPGIATVYLYDRGRTDLRDGAASPEVEAELRGAVGEVEAVAPLRRYRVAERGTPVDLRGAGGREGLRCQPLVLAFEGGTLADSTVCLGVVAGRFVKLRMTLPAAAEDFSAKAVAAFGQAVLAELQPPAPPPPAAPSRRRG